MEASRTGRWVAAVITGALLLTIASANWLGLTQGPYFEFERQSNALKKFYVSTQGDTKWPNQFRGGWTSQVPCAWDGNERAHPAPWGTRCVTGGWHQPPPRGDGGLLYLEPVSYTHLTLPTTPYV